MDKSSLQLVSNDVMFVHTNTHMHEDTHTHTHTQICAQNVSLPLALRTHLGGMWRNPPSPKRCQCLLDRLWLPVLIGCWLLNWIGGLLLGLGETAPSSSLL